MLGSRWLIVDAAFACLLGCGGSGTADPDAGVDAAADSGDGDGRIVLTGDCIEGQIETYIDESPGTPELHVIGLYQAEILVFDLHLDRPGPTVVFLSAYDRVVWQITQGPGVDLTRVIANGNGEPTVRVEGDVDVEIHSYEGNSDSICESEHELAAARAPDGPISVAQQMTGLELSSFQGCTKMARTSIE